jgi:hypothetical protein
VWQKRPVAATASARHAGAGAGGGPEQLKGGNCEVWPPSSPSHFGAAGGGEMGQGIGEGMGYGAAVGGGGGA